LNKKFNYYKHRISYLTGTCYNFEIEEFLASFCVVRVCQRQLGILVSKEEKREVPSSSVFSQNAILVFKP